ncbi:MAG: hypothetical protein ABIA78_03950 [archaeon]
MVNTINMQDMRHLNLFARITRVDTRFCFKYNETIVFGVPKPLVRRAVGENASNVRQLSQILRKKIKIIPKPRGIEDAKSFIESIVSPATINEVVVEGNEMIVTAGKQSKAVMIGRDKRRLLEMQKIVKDFFGKELRIV